MVAVVTVGTGTVEPDAAEFAGRTVETGVVVA